MKLTNTSLLRMLESDTVIDEETPHILWNWFIWYDMLRIGTSSGDTSMQSQFKKNTFKWNHSIHEGGEKENQEIIRYKLKLSVLILFYVSYLSFITILFSTFNPNTQFYLFLNFFFFQMCNILTSQICNSISKQFQINFKFIRNLFLLMRL